MTASRAAASAVPPREELIHQAWLLRRRSDARAMVELLRDVPKEVLFEELELAHLLSWALREKAEYRRSLELQLEIEPRVRVRGNDRLLRWWLLVAGTNWFYMGNSSAARDCWSECLDLASRVDDHYSTAWAANNLGGIEVHLGRFGEALASFQRAIAANHRMGYLRGLALGYHNLAGLQLEEGKPHQVLSTIRRAADYARPLNNLVLLRWHDVVRGRAYVQMGEIDPAEALLLRASAQFAGSGAWFEQVTALTHLGVCHRHAGRVQEARARFAGALRLSRAIRTRLLEPLVLVQIALMKDGLGDPSGAARAAQRARRLLEDFGGTYYLDKHLPSLSSATRELIGESRV